VTSENSTSSSSCRMYIRDRSIVLGVVPLVQCAQGAKKNTNEDAGPIGASATARFSRLEA